jgi:ribonuclease D
MHLDKYDHIDTITNTKQLAAFCEHLKIHEKSGFITVDTEFMRRTTYWSQLCLIQVASSDHVVLIDPLADGIDLKPFYEILAYQPLVKVFHAARQDVEIFFHAMGGVPAPLFDTQVAAMVCGYGDSIGYGNLVEELLKVGLDKTQRFTDWSRRPLKQDQLKYALQDVTHLRQVYEILQEKLQHEHRLVWIENEMRVLTDAKTYEINEMEVWQRIKVRSDQPRFLARMQYLAAARERHAIKQNKPRGHVASDLILLEMAADPPTSVEQIKALKSLSPSNELAKILFTALEEANALPDELCPRRERKEQRANILLVEILKVWLKQVAEDNKVASKLIATPDDIERFVNDPTAQIPMIFGWRHKIFGASAMEIAKGEKAVKYENGRLVLV